MNTQFKKILNPNFEITNSPSIRLSLVHFGLKPKVFRPSTGLKEKELRWREFWMLDSDAVLYILAEG